MKIAILMGALLWPLAGSGQETGSKQLKFETVSIKPTDLQVAHREGWIHTDPAIAQLEGFSLKFLLQMAYRGEEIVAPGWLDGAKFDIVATLPNQPDAEKRLPEMIRAVLAERFGIKFHHEVRDQPVYALMPAKGGLKLKPTANPSASSAGVRSVNAAGGIHLQKPNTTTTALAMVLTPILDRPVRDLTGATGSYDFELDFKQEEFSSRGNLPVRETSDSADATSIFDSLGRYGLRLEGRKVSIQRLVVDDIRKLPTEN